MNEPARDLFGEPIPETTRQEEIAIGRGAAVDELREQARIAETRAQRNPGDELLARRASKAREAYLSLRDYHERQGGLSLEAVAARAAAMNPEDRGVPLDPQNRDLFGGG